MTGPARIDSVEALREVKAMLAEFAETASLALVAVDADIARVKQWLNSERPLYWKRRIRELEDSVEAAKAEIRRKQIVAGSEPVSIVDERKKLNRAQARLEDAMRRAEATRRWAPAWERESMLYKSICTPLTEALHADIPRSMARLERMMGSLEDYLRLSTIAGDGHQAPPAAETDVKRTEAAPVPTGQDYRLLRSHVPPMTSRGEIPDRALIGLDWGAGEPGQADRRSLEALAASTAAGSPLGATLTLAWRAATEPSIYFARTEGAIPPDSGWYIGPVDRPEISGGLRVCLVSELLEQRPSLSSILAQAPGTLIVLTRGVVKAVLDGQERDVWSFPEGPVT